MRGRHVWASVCLLTEVSSCSHFSLEWTFSTFRQQEYNLLLIFFIETSLANRRRVSSRVTEN